MIASPCTKLCTLDADGWCLGCGRTLVEIGDWLEADDATKRVILARSADRLRRPIARRG